MPLPTGTPFIVFGDDWGRYPSTLQHTFRHIAAQYPVVWVNGIGHRIPRFTLTDARRAWEKLSRVWEARGTPARASGHSAALGGSEPVAVVEPRVLPWHHVGPIHRWNTRSLVRTLRAQLHSLGLNQPPVLVTGSPPSVGVVGQLGEIASVYFVLDDFLNFPTYTATMLAPLEDNLLQKVDAVIATAASLTKSKFPRSGRAYHVPQGVNFAHFSVPRPEPADLASIPRPRIGFAGSVSTQCDLSLFAQLADAFPSASLVLVGPVALGESALASLRRPNVHILGARSYADLPAYVQHFDVGIIPYVLSGWTVAVDPLKLLEYLAAGLSVVTTAIPEVHKYADVVAVTESSDAFVAAVGEALASPGTRREKGLALAEANRWERRAETVLELIETTVDERA